MTALGSGRFVDKYLTGRLLMDLTNHQLQNKTYSCIWLLFYASMYNVWQVKQYTGVIINQLVHCT